jgi:hypothetical protein
MGEVSILTSLKQKAVQHYLYIATSRLQGNLQGTKHKHNQILLTKLNE